MNVNLRQYWEQFEKDERKFKSNINGFFSRQLRPLLKEIRNSNPYTIEGKVDSLIQEQDLLDIFIKNYQQFGAKYYVNTMNSLQKKAPYNLTTKQELPDNDPFFYQMVDFVTNKVADRVKTITRTSRDYSKRAIVASIDEGLEKGLSIPNLSKLIEKNVKTEWRIMKKFRSSVIARTETLSATNHASYMGAVNTGLDVKKKWRSFIDNRTRGTHIDANGDEVPLKDYFQVGDSLMLHPGDPNGSAREVIQCRCTLSYVV